MDSINLVSVPTKGTHLLYQQQVFIEIKNKCFRPHEGDPSSLHMDLLYMGKEEMVSVPTKGTHLLY